MSGASRPPLPPPSAAPQSAPRRGRQLAGAQHGRVWVWVVVGALVAATVVGLALTVGRGGEAPLVESGGSVSGPKGSAAEPATTTSVFVDPRETLVRAPGDMGTIESPVPIGRFSDIGDGWRMRVNWVDFSSDDDVAAASKYNDPPEPGRTYVVANLSFAYRGPSPDAASNVNTFYVATSSGHVIDMLSDPAGSTSAPDPTLPYLSDPIPGELLTGNIVYSVPDADLATLLVVARPFGLSSDSDSTHFASS